MSPITQGRNSKLQGSKGHKARTKGWASKCRCLKDQLMNSKMSLTALEKRMRILDIRKNSRNETLKMLCGKTNRYTQNLKILKMCSLERLYKGQLKIPRPS